MKLKHLESSLSKCTREFPSPKVELEQYPTSAHLAAWVGLTALENNDIGLGRSCLDLGCGTAMLLISCALLGTEMCYGVDCDEEALEVATENIDVLQETGDLDADDETRIELILARLRPIYSEQQSSSTPPSENNTKFHPKSKGKRGGRGRGRGGRGGRGGRNNKQQHSAPQGLPPPPSPLVAGGDDNDDGIPLKSNLVDTVVTNPPFGTKNNAGMDIQFLRCAIRLATKAVYSFHKTSTRAYLIKTLEKWGITDVKVVAQMKFDIPQTYKFHSKKNVDVEVDLLRVGIPPLAPVSSSSQQEEDGDEGEGESIDPANRIIPTENNEDEEDSDNSDDYHDE